VALRVTKLPEGTDTETELGEGVRVRLVAAPTDSEYDLDHVALYSADPARTAESYEQFGFEPAPPSPEGHPRVEVGGAYVEFHPGEPGDPEKPLLNHLAVLVDSVEEHIAEAEDMGVVDNVVDAANTRAVFVWGPERVRIEYVEHKPEFALT
jgi:catechol 2,3-dioxygenase-like lactoylglutathione lyase family enzyme